LTIRKFESKALISLLDLLLPILYQQPPKLLFLFGDINNLFAKIFSQDESQQVIKCPACLWWAFSAHRT